MAYPIPMPGDVHYATILIPIYIICTNYGFYEQLGKILQFIHDTPFTKWLAIVHTAYVNLTCKLNFTIKLK